MFEYLEQKDQALFLFLNGKHVDWLDLPMVLISEPLFWLPVYILFFVWFWRRFRSWKGMALAIVAIGLTVTFADMTSTRAFKKTFKRYRPSHHTTIGPQTHVIENLEGEIYRGGKYGFISGHSANFFGIACCVFLLMGKPISKWWLFVWAGLIAYSRIYLGVHYPSDILCGAIVGIACGAVAFKIADLISRKLVT